MALALALLAPRLAGATPSVAEWVDSATAAADFAKLDRARIAREGADPAAVLAALEGVGPGPANLAALWRAEAHAALGDEAAALAAVRAAAPRTLGCDVDDVAAEGLAVFEAAQLASTDPPAAARLLERLPADGGRLAIAIALLEASDRVEDARALQVRLLVETPGSAEARALAQTLGRGGVAKRLGRPARRLERARRLLGGHANADAAAEAAALAKALDADDPMTCELGYIEGKARRKLRSYRPAQRALERARLRCAELGQTDFALRAALLETRVRSIRGQSRGTRRLASWIQQQAPGHRYADDALAMHADVLGRRGKTKQARAAYLELIERFPDADHAPMAAWRLAFVAILAGDHAAAAPHLEHILAMKRVRPMARARARYWRAQAKLTSGDRAAAKADFDALVRAPSFYAWMALDRLGSTEPGWVKGWQDELRRLREAPEVAVAAADLGAAKAAAHTAAQLVGLGRPDLAEAELASVACAVKADPARRALAVAYDALGLHREAQRIARSRQPIWRVGSVSSARMTDWRLAYSRPFRAEIETAAKAAKLSPLFLTALSREESTFDPDIVSWAGATGLAQLMPATAVGAYADVFGGRLDMSRLTEPQLNLRLGAHVLGQGLRAFRRAEPLALAAYNGGPGLARRFVPATALPFDTWVETMTVKETRRYVKRVVETWGVYRWLYDRESPFIRLPDSVGGPEWKRR